MRKLINFLFVISIVNVIAGCASAPGNADEQRARAEKAQGELSSETKK
jgi:starvation-inducible outer membrane lipoprotein